MIASRIGMSPLLRRPMFTRALSTKLTSSRPNRVAGLQVDAIAKVKQMSTRTNAVVPRAKSSSHWTLNDLESFNIHLEQQSALKFFDVEKLPEPAVDPELLSVRDADGMAQARHAHLITLLELAMLPRNHDSVVPDFLVALFNIMGYTDRYRVACRQRDLLLPMCGKWMHIKTDVILDYPPWQPNDILLVTREDKHIEGQDSEEVVNAQAQIVAQAVAAFTENNVKRALAGLDLLTEEVMPGIVMKGTSPLFFKIPVTEDLATHIRHGTYPDLRTCVTFCQTPVPRAIQHEGMMSLDARRQILSCYEAFKTVVGI